MVRLRAESSNAGGSGPAPLRLSGPGLDLNPLPSCWKDEGSLDVKDVQELLMTCWADATVNSAVHALVLYSSDSTAVPLDLLPSKHAASSLKEVALEDLTEFADGSLCYDVVLICGGMKDVTEPKAFLQKVLHVLKPGGGLIFLAKHPARAAPPQGTNGLSYPAVVRQLFFSTGLCDIRELQVSDVGNSGRGMKLCAVVGSRPGTPQGLEAALAADSTGYSSRSAIIAADMVRRQDGQFTMRIQKSWIHALNAMREEAMLMGIPSSAVPEVKSDASLEELQAARERLSGMIASFLSSGL